MSLTTTCRVTWHMVCGHPYHGNPTHNPVGGIPTPLKNMKVSWDYYSQLNGQKKVPHHQPVMGYLQMNMEQMDISG